MRRTLTLKKDVLTELTALTDGDLGAVAGGVPTGKDICAVLTLEVGCGAPTCGRGCTGTSTARQTH